MENTSSSAVSWYMGSSADLRDAMMDSFVSISSTVMSRVPRDSPLPAVFPPSPMGGGAAGSLSFLVHACFTAAVGDCFSSDRGGLVNFASSGLAVELDFTLLAPVMGLDLAPFGLLVELCFTPSGVMPLGLTEGNDFVLASEPLDFVPLGGLDFRLEDGLDFATLGLANWLEFAPVGLAEGFAPELPWSALFGLDLSLSAVDIGVADFSGLEEVVVGL